MYIVNINYYLHNIPSNKKKNMNYLLIHLLYKIDKPSQNYKYCKDIDIKNMNYQSKMYHQDNSTHMMNLISTDNIPMNMSNNNSMMSHMLHIKPNNLHIHYLFCTNQQDIKLDNY